MKTVRKIAQNAIFKKRNIAHAQGTVRPNGAAHKFADILKRLRRFCDSELAKRLGK